MITKVDSFSLREMMRDQVVRFHFVKANGDHREAYGTLNFDLIRAEGSEPSDEHSKDHIPGLVTYYDIVKREWRSFKEERFLGVDDDYGL